MRAELSLSHLIFGEPQQDVLTIGVHVLEHSDIQEIQNAKTNDNNRHLKEETK